MPGSGDRLAVVPLPGGPRVTKTDATNGPVAEYDAGRQLFRKRAYAQAAQVFSRFARRYPRHTHADNALYWLAECFYRQGRVRKAAWVLRQLLKRYASGNKAPSGLLKLALCEQRLGRKAQARKVFGQVVRLYPRTREAAQAAAHLRRLK